MNIQDYIKNLSLAKRQAEQRFSRSLSQIERDVLDGTYEWLVENLEYTKTEIPITEDLVAVMDRLIGAVVEIVNSSPQFQSTLGQFLGDLTSISNNAKKFHKTTNNFDINTAGVNEVQKAVVADIIDQYTGNGLNAHFAAPLKENIFRNILAGADMQDVKKVLKTYILSGQDQSGKLGSYLEQTAMQAVDSYTGSINQQLMKEFKYTGLIISGSLIETSSKQCIKAVEESSGTTGYLTKAQWEEVLDVARNNPKARLIPGTTLENLPINKLHWGCRHDFTPVIMEDARPSADSIPIKETPVKPKPPEKQPEKAPTANRAVFKEAKTKVEARNNFRDIMNNSGVQVATVRMDSALTIEQMNKVNKKLSELVNEYKISSAWDTSSPTKVSMASTRRSYGFVKPARGRESGDLSIAEVNFGSLFDRSRSNFYLPSEISSKKKSKVNAENVEVATVVHEYGHFMSISQHSRKEAAYWNEAKLLREEYSKELARLQRENDLEGLRDVYLGKYASTNLDEFIAEGFTEYKLATDASPFAVKIGKLIDKYFKK